MLVPEVRPLVKGTSAPETAAGVLPVELRERPAHVVEQRILRSTKSCEPIAIIASRISWSPSRWLEGFGHDRQNGGMRMMHGYQRQTGAGNRASGQSIASETHLRYLAVPTAPTARFAIKRLKLHKSRGGLPVNQGFRSLAKYSA